MNKQLIDAIDAFECQQYNEAIELLNQVVDEDKTHWTAWYYLAMAYGFAGRTKSACRILPVIAAMCPDHRMQDKARRGLLTFTTEFYDRLQVDHPDDHELSR
ncbi:MAG TPA: tetratricopeptide repeat protein [Candidatus Obscuribacterales bacterium]